MPMSPASNPLDTIERMEIENNIEAMRGFRRMPPVARQKLINAIAGHAFRLWAEVLRLEAALEISEKTSENRRESIVCGAERELHLMEKWSKADIALGNAVDILREVSATLGWIVTEPGFQITTDAVHGRQDPAGVNGAFAKVTKFLEGYPKPAPMCKDPLSDIIPSVDAPPQEGGPK